MGAGRAVDGIDAERGDEGFGGGEAFALGQDRPRFGRIAIDLIGVEQAERPGEKPSVVAIIVAGFVILRAKLLPDDAEDSVLALEIGSASWREGVFEYLYILVVAVSIKNKQRGTAIITA